MNDSLQAPLRQPKTSIFDITLAGAQDPLPAEKPAQGFWNRLFHRKPEAALPLDSLPTVASSEPGDAIQLLHGPSAQPFDLTEHGVLETTGPMREIDLQPAGTQAPYSPTYTLHPGARPFDLTEHGIPEPTGPWEEVTLNLVVAEPASSAACAPPMTEPLASADASSSLEVPDSELWDEGTAAEWNPRWGQLPEADPEPPELPQKASRLRFTVIGSLGLATGLLLLFVSLRPLFLHASRAQAAPAPIPEALRPYVAKADAGDTAAMRMLGLRYSYGVGAPLDRSEGIKWLRRAAAGGNAAARNELGDMGIQAN